MFRKKERDDITDICNKYITIGKLYKDQKNIKVYKYVEFITRLIPGFSDKVQTIAIKENDHSEQNLVAISNKLIGEWLGEHTELCRAFISDYLKKNNENDKNKSTEVTVTQEDLRDFLSSHKTIIESIPINFKQFSILFLQNYPIKSPIPLKNIDLAITRLKNEVTFRKNAVLNMNKLSDIIRRVIFSKETYSITDPLDYIQKTVESDSDSDILESDKLESKSDSDKLDSDNSESDSDNLEYIIDPLESLDIRPSFSSFKKRFDLE
jgi:hypothetical protein